jgi:hypothetical protein
MSLATKDPPNPDTNAGSKKCNTCHSKPTPPQSPAPAAGTDPLQSAPIDPFTGSDGNETDGAPECIIFTNAPGKSAISGMTSCGSPQTLAGPTGICKCIADAVAAGTPPFNTTNGMIVKDLCDALAAYQAQPLAVTLTSFEAAAVAGAIALSWTTESEVDNEGFRVLRATDPDDEFAAVSGFIPAEGGPAFGADYGFIDDAVEPGVSYYYLLQDVDTSGFTTLHGADACNYRTDLDCDPVAAMVPWPPAADFCAEHQIRQSWSRARLSDMWACLLADWKENEPDRRFPNDCAIARNPASRSLICEATRDAN